MPSAHTQSPVTVHTTVMAVTGLSLIQQQQGSPDFCYTYEYLANGELPPDKKLAFKTVAESQQYIIEYDTNIL